MATVKKFEDLISWQKARELTRYIYTLTKKPSFRNDYGLKNQIERAAVSTMANQAEGFTRGTKIELINYFYIAKGSAGEVQSHLYTAKDQRYIDISEFQHAYNLADSTQRLIESFVNKVKAGAWKGIQYKQPKYRNIDMSNQLREQIAAKKMKGEDASELQEQLLKLEGI